MGDYAKALGSKLRAIRQQQGLSLHGVEQKSGGRWKAVVVGSYERGDRAVTVQKLAELADFYGVPVAELLPEGRIPSGSEPATKIVINLERLQQLPADKVGPLARYAAAIQSQRGDYNGKVLSIRAEDLRSLAIIYDKTPGELTDQLIDWGVLPPEARPIGYAVSAHGDRGRASRAAVAPAGGDGLRRRRSRRSRSSPRHQGDRHADRRQHRPDRGWCGVAQPGGQHEPAQGRAQRVRDVEARLHRGRRQRRGLPGGVEHHRLHHRHQREAQCADRERGHRRAAPRECTAATAAEEHRPTARRARRRPPAGCPCGRRAGRPGTSRRSCRDPAGPA